VSAGSRRVQAELWQKGREMKGEAVAWQKEWHAGGKGMTAEAGSVEVKVYGEKRCFAKKNGFFFELPEQRNPARVQRVVGGW